MKKAHQRIFIAVGIITLCGTAYLNRSHDKPWRDNTPRHPVAQKDKQDPSALAYRAIDPLSLIAGVEKQGDELYVGTPAWQTNRDILGVKVPDGKGRLHSLELQRFEGDKDGVFIKGAVIFRMDTLSDPPVQILGVQRLHYEARQNRVLASGKPLLAVVSPPGGTVGYAFLALSADGDPAMLRFSKTGRTPQGYQRTDAGLLALALSANQLRLTLHYIAKLTPPDGQCRPGQATPCRQIETRFSAPDPDGDESTAGFDTVKLDSTLRSGQGQQADSTRLQYDPARFAFLRFAGRGIQHIASLSPAMADAFLAGLPPIAAARQKTPGAPGD